MKKSITPNQIKQNNYSLIYHYIYKNRNVSQQDISYNLRLSRPTVTANLTKMENDGLIQKSGQIDTEFVGRKASAYSIVPDFRVGIGVEILKKEVKIIAVNLYGEKIDRLAFDFDYEETESYFRTVCHKILEFKERLGLSEEHILGIGFAMQALVSPDRKTIVYGKILSCTGLSISRFTKYLPYPCSFIHDAQSAAVAELWISPELKNAFYLSISKHLGAAVITNGEFLTGKHGHSSTIEHIQMEPRGKLCYCGKHGCIETLCSLTALLEEKETPDEFFLYLRQGNLIYKKRWEHFLTNLARSVNMLHLVYDTDFILGGYLASYLCQEDLDFLYEKIRQITPFEEADDFLRISKMPKHNITIGSALPYIQKFLNTLAES
ncbi:MAG TPA: ROK family transcriptional regulator [Candidatus Blautia avistercoris]|uniref:ROK family transcriptional regulator n=1 Tax=Blautia sp. An249 TaxID=1965603 RepID=UPI000B36F781|nr:ROK family transcriptional regulator [Blautia sp. An249]OUO77971.1 NagC family transcriptional regulator [Blautia sp. An249]HIY18363.1 ROK family transcriptional regulator [Candidatus Blautia avistercoris]